MAGLPTSNTAPLTPTNATNNSAAPQTSAAQSVGGMNPALNVSWPPLMPTQTNNSPHPLGLLPRGPASNNSATSGGSRAQNNSGSTAIDPNTMNNNSNNRVGTHADNSFQNRPNDFAGRTGVHSVPIGNGSNSDLQDRINHLNGRISMVRIGSDPANNTDLHVEVDIIRIRINNLSTVIDAAAPLNAGAPLTTANMNLHIQIENLRDRINQLHNRVHTVSRNDVSRNNVSRNNVSRNAVSRNAVSRNDVSRNDPFAIVPSYREVMGQPEYRGSLIWPPPAEEILRMVPDEGILFAELYRSLDPPFGRALRSRESLHGLLDNIRRATYTMDYRIYRRRRVVSAEQLGNEDVSNSVRPHQVQFE
ncbi:hypothetical protein K490DRAFT_56781 [Saccharata proteae CBS 121410]|uniref:Uncharacterized protein n=1 Tax=Saccharata proteae CBS 121410 TaxID=1314787 RepID=A0A9P4LZ30_9PEZI|nr:hypothetical protein K490DRAFT_56781 [Saccharata proteae CBS 121410]